VHEADEAAVYFIYIICRAAEAARRGRRRSSWGLIWFPSVPQVPLSWLHKSPGSGMHVTERHRFRMGFARW